MLITFTLFFGKARVRSHSLLVEQNGYPGVYGLYRRAHCDRWNFIYHKVGKRIRPLNVEKQRSEANFELILCSIISRLN